MAEHSPGPWQDRVVNHTWPDTIRDSKGYDIAQVIPRLQEAESRANARLIASAPDLLAGCKSLLPRCGCGGKGYLERRKYDAASGEMEWDGFDDCPHCKATRAAIRKAEGTDQAAGE